MPNNREVILSELQAMTGIVTTDLNYLAFLLLKDGCYFDGIRAEQFKAPVDEITERAIKETQVLSFEDFMKSLT